MTGISALQTLRFQQMCLQAVFVMFAYKCQGSANLVISSLFHLCWIAVKCCCRFLKFGVSVVCLGPEDRFQHVECYPGSAVSILVMCPTVIAVYQGMWLYKNPNFLCS